jgi:hypothetical protein
MPKWITAIFVFFLSTTLLTARAITVEDVIEKHVKVMAAEEPGNQDIDNEVFGNYLRKGYKAKLEGIERVDGKPCYKLSFDLPAGNKISYFIDAKSWYVTGMSVAVAGKAPGTNIANEGDRRGNYSCTSVPENDDN